jgi:hypothetical protein
VRRDGGEGVRGGATYRAAANLGVRARLEGRRDPRRESRAGVAGGGRRDRQAGPGCSEGKGDARVGAGVWGHAAAGPLGQRREATRGASGGDAGAGRDGPARAAARAGVWRSGPGARGSGPG